MKLQQYSVFSILSLLWVVVIANFQNRFVNTIRGSDILLQWDLINSTKYPLVIHCRLINQTSQYGANSLEVNITSGLNASSFLWKSVPYPLPYLETAKYKVDIWPQNWERPGASAFASSPDFTIFELEGGKDTDGMEGPFNETVIIPSKPNNQPGSNGGVNNNTAIAAGLIVPIVVILAVLGFVWMQQRQKRILEEKRKQREGLYID
ncbi:hypothetical protein F5Y05DRAFT_378287 [Hypoxylon sp. FL0543]|nr:hypothetical protein F5Y05DRAFT_378287 [Hypoxylon sp. FL0543]